MIDQRVRDAFYEYLDDRARHGMLECDQPSEGQAVEDWMIEKLTKAGRWPLKEHA